RNGGWPLTMFLAPQDQRPFFWGTYFSHETPYGMPAFTDVLKRVSEYYSGHLDDLRQQSEALMSALGDLTPPVAGADLELSAKPLQLARDALGQTFDSRYGGF